MTYAIEILLLSYILYIIIKYTYKLLGYIFHLFYKPKTINLDLDNYIDPESGKSLEELRREQISKKIVENKVHKIY